MLDRIAARLLTRRPSPTVDLYFLNACSDLVGPAGPVRRVAPTVFESDTARLVIRHDTGAPTARGEEGLVYLLDDAVFVGLHDRSLPAAYRAKLQAVDCAAARRLLPRVDVLVVSTPEVAESLPRGLLRPDARVVQLDPYWLGSLPGLAHFDATTPLEVAFLGAGTHAAAIPFLGAMLGPLLRAHPEMRITVSANHGRAMARAVPPDRLRVLSPVTWEEYRSQLAGLRAHLALYPLAETAFARARSSNKLIEHALVGAAPLYSGGWPRARLAASEGAGLALPPSPAAWAEAVAVLLDDRPGLRGLAARAQALAARINVAERQRTIWEELLALGCIGHRPCYQAADPPAAP